jgi:mitochondrial import receptor subunit TOM40
MLQLEQDYQGSDYSFNFKTVNPSPVDSTGIFILSYLQSVTQKLSIGTEIVYQKLTSDIEETVKQYVMKYTGKDYIATLNYQEAGALQASYYQKINEKVDFGTELQMLLEGGRRAVCTVVSMLTCKRDRERKGQKMSVRLMATNLVIIIGSQFYLFTPFSLFLC